MKFEIYEAFHSGSSDGIEWEFQSAGWYWRLRARNGRIIADGAEAYASKKNIKRAIWRLQEAMLYAGRPLEVVEVDK